MTPKQDDIKSGLSGIVAEWLWVHLQQWVDKGIITPGQMEKIKNLYLWPNQVSQSLEPAQPVNLLAVLQIIGAILIGAGIITFVAFNWPKLPSEIKLVIVLGLIIAIHCAGAVLTWRLPFPSAGRALILLGNLVYGAGIWLVAQIYHLPSNFPRGMLIWAAGVLPMAFVFKSKSNYFLAVFLFILWTFNLSLGDKTPQPIFLVVLLGLLVPMAYYLRSPTGLLLCLATGGLWLYQNQFLWADETLSVYLLLPLAFYALLLLAVSNLHAAKASWAPYRPMYAGVGWAIAACLLLIQPFYGIWAVEHSAPSFSDLSWPFWGSCALLGLGFAAAAVVGRKKFLDDTARVLNHILPFLAAAMLLWLVLPHVKFSVLPSLLGWGLLAFAHWHATRSTAGVNVLFIAVPAWLLAVGLNWQHEFALIFVMALFSLLVYLRGWDLQIRGDHELPVLYKLLGLMAYISTVGLMTFHSFNLHYLDSKLPYHTHHDFWIIAGLLEAGIMAGMIRAFPYAYPRAARGLLPEEQGLLAVLAFLPLAVFAFLLGAQVEDGFTLGMNGILILMLITLLIAGYRRNEAYLKALSFIFIALLVGCRYFEMDWSLLYKSVLLVGTGIIILLVGIAFEKNKAKVAVLE